MSNKPEPNPHRLTLDPFHPLFVWAYPIAWRNAMAAQVVLGDRKNIERANDIKGAMRNVLRGPVSEFAPFLTLMESEECANFDYVLVDWNGIQVAARWGRIPSTGVIRRNPTLNTALVQEQGTLFGGGGKSIEDIPLFTYGYTVERDFTLNGIPQGYMERLKLCREWGDEHTEVIQTLAVFSEPVNQVIDEGLFASRITARAAEEAQLKALIRSIRRRLA